MRALLLVLLGVLVGCPSPAPPPPVHADATVGDAGGTCQTACDRLSALNCREGLAPNCVPVCEHTVAAHFVNLHVDCLSSATSVEDARGCGVACR